MTSAGYAAYGLSILSDLPLPELPPADRPADVRVCLEPEARPVLRADAASIWEGLDRNEGSLAHPRVGRLRIRDGREVIVTPAPGATEALLRLYVLGPALGALLYQRGLLVLHASAVEVGGGVVAFPAESGCGKSAIALALEGLGHRVLADDIAAVDLASGNALLLPAYPYVKASPEVLIAVGHDPAKSFELHPQEFKRGWWLAELPGDRPRPLRRIYLLQKEARSGFELLQPSAALIELIRYSYPTRTGLPGDAAHLQQCAQLVRSAPVYRMGRAEDVRLLPALAKAIEEHLEFVMEAEDHGRIDHGT